MKNYKKAQVVAKNAPTGSYAAGCPTLKRDSALPSASCKKCELTK